MSHPITFTNSERSALICERLWAIQYGSKFRPKKESPALVMGSIWHEALSSWWTNGADLRLEAAKVAIQSLCDEARVRSEQRPSGFSLDLSNRDALSMDEIGRIESTLLGMIRSYDEVYRTQDLVLDADEIEVERLILDAGTVCNGVLVTSPVYYRGKVDKLAVDQYHQVWIVEHKTSSSPLDQWLSRHAYNPQALSYALAVEATVGVRPVGVIYDLSLKEIPPTWEDFKLVKDGTRLSKQTPAGASSYAFLDALRLNGFSITDQDWYGTKLDALEALEAREGVHSRYHRREIVRFDAQPEKLDRVLGELKAAAIQIASMETNLRAMRSGTGRESAIHALALSERVGLFPRQAGACYRYGRLCAYAGMCESPTMESARPFNMLGVKHPELEGDDL